MNQIYSLVLNHATGACQAVSEVAKGSRQAASATSGEACMPRRTRLASACLIALAALAGTSAWAQDTSTNITGTPGTNGSVAVPVGTNGTAGADAVQATGDGTHSGVLTGGVGGNGGSGTVLGGDGGSGGAGLSNTVDGVGIYNTGSILGGQGGNGGGGATAGAGGTGGTGVQLTAPEALDVGVQNTLINVGTIEGGSGGLGGLAASAGGVGVTATAGTSFENSGTVRGGLSGDGVSRADAIRFTGDNNFLGLTSTSVIEGNVVGSLSNGDTLGLSGSTDGSFDATLIGPASQYRNFAGFQKIDTSTWTLTGSTTALTPWQIRSGTLAISSDASLGDAAGVLTLDGGTLRSTADTTASRAIVLGTANATLETNVGTTYTANGVISGSGKLTKTGEGTATFTADNTYTGGTTISAGTLELGNGGTTGAIVGDVANSGTLAFNRSNAAVFGGVVSGAGGVDQRGTGTTTLTGANTYTGGTTITAGTLELGNGGTTGAITGDVTNSGTLTFNRSDDTAFGAVISGSGTLEQRGTGTTTLTGVNSYTGGTTISAGTLALGNGGTTGAIAGDVTNNATLAFNRSDATAFGSVISGSGRVDQRGTNTTTLTGANTYTGGTTISAGELELGNGGTTGAITGDVTNNAKLAFNRSDANAFSGAVSGSGSVEQRGTGTTTLTGANSYTGGTTITAGTLELGNGGTTGAIAGDVTNNATLAFNRSDATAFGGVISGSGSVDQRGTGTTTLAGANSYTGGTTITAGTLELGNGGAIAGDVTNNATLAFNRSDANVFNGVVSGSGSVDQRGTGTTTLTGANTYTGGTTISAGTLALGNGGTTGAITGDVTNNATLAFNRSDANVFNGVVSGSGSVDQRGTGTTTLTGANIYTGGTTITAGTLELGNGGTTGAIVGDVANSGTLAFNRSDANVFNGVISGNGSLEQRGTGTTTLSGVNTYSGGTSVLNGTLAGNAASFGSGAIANNAALVVDQTSDGALNNVLSGAGRITKTGAGALMLLGNSAAFAGTTQVTAGTLAVNGSLGGTLTVGNGARLAGTGSVGNTVVQSGATVAPGGNTIGTLNVAGNLTLAQGSVYQLNAAADGRSDQIRVSGVTTLQGGNVSVLASGNFQPTTSYSILTANGGVSGQFAGATTDMAFLDPFLTYSPQNVTLRLQRNNVNFQNIAQTSNQRATAGALSALQIGPLYSAVVALNAAGARTAFDSLSGEVHASLKSAAFEDSRFVRNASLGRLREAFDTPAGTATEAPAASGSGVWAQAFDSWGSTDADGNASSVERSTRGIFLGADTRVGDDWRLGVLGGYSTSHLTPDDRPSWAKTDTYHVGVYGGKQWGQLGLRAGATYSAGEADTRRDIAFPGFSGQTAAKYDINTTQAFGELGWKMPTANGSLEPFAGLAHVKLSTDGFTESGGVAALTGSNGSAHTTYSTLGLRGTSNAGMPNNQTRLRGLVGWRHAFGDVTPTSALALAGQPGFTVAGVPIARNALVLEGGIDFAVSRNLTMGVSYVGQASSQVSDHGIKASLLWKF